MKKYILEDNKTDVSQYYTSVNQFLDKSIIYAASVLKEIDFIPDYILSVPSSSDYNKFYCTNLSNKLGIPYIEDFFMRNVLEVSYDKKGLMEHGFTPEDIFSLDEEIRKAKLDEIGGYIKQPVAEFCKKYKNHFNQIGEQYGYTYENFIPFIAQYIYNSLMKNKNFLNKNEIDMAHPADDLTIIVLQTFLDDIKLSKLNKEEENESVNQRKKYLQNSIYKIIYDYAYDDFFNMINKVEYILWYYRKKLQEGDSVDINFVSKKFKITKVGKRFRNYLQNVYIVYNSYINKQTGSLTSTFDNPSTKLLIFDEDINSGGSLKLTVDALKYRFMLSKRHNDIMKDEKMIDEINREVDVELGMRVKCLVNAWSDKGI